MTSASPHFFARSHSVGFAIMSHIVSPLDKPSTYRDSQSSVRLLELSLLLSRFELAQLTQLLSPHRCLLASSSIDSEKGPCLPTLQHFTSAT